MSDPWARWRPLPHEQREMPVIGLRSWRVDYPSLIGERVRLRGTGLAWVWRPGRIEAARCITGLHEAPQESCACGLYALNHHKGSSQLTHGPIAGVVACYGKIIQHGDEGFRAQYAQIIGILRTGDLVRNVFYGVTRDGKARRLRGGAHSDLMVGPQPQFRRIFMQRVDVEVEVAQTYGVPLLDAQGLRLLAREYGDRL